MALVGVEHLRRQSESTQGAHTGDAKHHLLAQSVLNVASVESVGDAWRVEQIQRNAANIGAPDSHVDGLASEVEAHVQIGVGQRHARGLEPREPLLLPTVGVEALAEIALAVEQTNSNQRYAKIGRGLEVIARQHAEAAAVLRHRFADAELGREIGNEVERRIALRLKPSGRGERCVETHDGVGHRLHDGWIGGEVAPRFGCDSSQHL